MWNQTFLLGSNSLNINCGRFANFSVNFGYQKNLISYFSIERQFCSGFNFNPKSDSKFSLSPDEPANICLWIINWFSFFCLLPYFLLKSLTVSSFSLFHSDI